MSENNRCQAYYDYVESMRHTLGYLSLSELIDIAKRGNVILDPMSTLISKDVIIGAHNRFYPNVTIESDEGGRISIGNNNVFFSSTHLLAVQGQIEIGNNNIIGDGGIRIKANIDGAHIKIEDDGRYVNNPEIMGTCHFGNGCQILGNITVQNCVLAGGGSFKSKDPDLRGALLKGYGLARNLHLEQGQVINGRGHFSDDLIELQSAYH
ncbi:MAG: hypothetical protein KC546_07540 [Anaerolineae bacterium]|nr:hypothetical protein [Anaerolineae bacterium]